MRLTEAQRLIDLVIANLSPFIIKSTAVGSVRRKQAEIGDLDILIEIKEQDVERVKYACRRFATLHSGGTRKLRLGNLFGTKAEMDIWLTYPPRNFYALQAIFTGPDHVTIKLRENLERKGVKRPHAKLPVRSEEEYFKLAGLDYLPPEDRHTL